MSDKTTIINIEEIKNKLVSQTLEEVYKILEERGYNPINQITGYLISGDPGYITNYKDARNKLLELDRTELVAFLLKDYINKI